jgi:3-(3-hydroxy-phenyl)propionate hydroxylase
MLDSKPPVASPYQEAAHNNGYEFSQGTGYQLPEYPFVEPPELSTGEVKRHDIVIVGGGLAGLTLACALAQYGIKALLLDEDNTVGVKGASSRGICYAQKTLEIFKRLGLYDRIAAKGVQWSVGRTFAGHDEVYSFDLKAQQTHNVSTQPPFINIQQFYVEGFLVEQIYKITAANSADSSVDLRWSHRITAFEQNDDYATLQLQTPAGAYTLEATHVVDCSGARSPFRAWVAAAVTAKKGDDRWCIADVRFKNPPAVERHTWIEAPFNEGRAVWQHLMADGVWRIDYQMRPDADPEEVSREDVVRERINGQLGRVVDPSEYEIVWVGPYAYRSECLDQLRCGRVLFVGDAAHVVSPFGARGGNSGVQDADNLAWKLAAVVQRRAAPALLDSYHDERHEAATHNVLVTNRTARFLRPADGAERVLRTAAISLAKRHAFARQLVNTGRMSSPNIYSRTGTCHTSGGRPAQNTALRWADASGGDLADLLVWANGNLLLLVFGELSQQNIANLASLGGTAAVRCVQIGTPKLRAQVIEYAVDASGHLHATCAGSDSANIRWALLRPDTYIAATGSQIDGSVVNAISSALGHPT